MNCPNCGTANEGGGTFCTSCGTEFHNLEAPAAGSAPAATTKPYKAEVIMGLIGSIVGVVIFLVMLISGIVRLGAYFSYGGGLAITGSMFVLAAFILGFIGTGQLNKGLGKGGILLTIGGGLGFIASFIGIWVGWSAWFFFPLLLAAGIMALARKRSVEQG